MISLGSLSETWAAPPRAGVDAPLALERSLPLVAQTDDLLDQIEAHARALASLPAPFRQILEVRRSASVVEVLQERFVGLSSPRLVSALARDGRLLPLDVWLGLADLLCRAWAALPRQGPASRLVPTVHTFGVDLRRRVVLFPEPDHSLEFELERSTTSGQLSHTRFENLSPEHVSVHASRFGQAARMFSLATVLVELLTLERPFRRPTDLDTVQAVLSGEARWRPARHPDCPPGLGRLLAGAMARRPIDRPMSLEALRRKLVEEAGVAPASPERIAQVLLGVDLAATGRMLAALRDQPEFLPESWRDGGLEVIQDQLLETLTPIDQLPLLPKA